LQELLSHIIDVVYTKEKDNPLRDSILTSVRETFNGLIRETERREKVIRDRIGDEVFNDSDGDGVSNYDEVNLYDTDPFNPDTDGDGFLDGSEIVNGFNPKDPRAEAIVGYESPQQTGITREDILSVDTITAVSDDNKSNTAVAAPPEAVIEGRGLPNAFLTLYVFSTPIVVTVKTDADGQWSYKFEKELEDGRHEVYVGVTDNVGRIVAKSNPLAFVKTAQAFTPVDSSGAATLSPSSSGPSFVSENSLLLVASLGVVALGLVLMLLGFHMRTYQMRRVPGSQVV
jgi:hypothetical protein